MKLATHLMVCLLAVASGVRHLPGDKMNIQAVKSVVPEDHHPVMTALHVAWNTSDKNPKFKAQKAWHNNVDTSPFQRSSGSGSDSGSSGSASDSGPFHHRGGMGGSDSSSGQGSDIARRLVSRFSGLTSLDNPLDVYPPDSHGAAGPYSVVTVANLAVNIRCRRTGMSQTHVFTDFFMAGGETVHGYGFDPKIRFDPWMGRFVIVYMSVIRAAPSPKSRIHFAVSKAGVEYPSAPTDWVMWGYDALIGNMGETSWADYPGIALDEEAIYLTVNYFGTDGSMALAAAPAIIALPKASVYDGSMREGDVRTHVLTPNHVDPAVRVTLMPARPVGPRGDGPHTMYFIGTGLFNRYGHLVQLWTVVNPLSMTPTFSWEHILVLESNEANRRPQNAEQRGSRSLINVLDGRAEDAIWDRTRGHVAVTTRLANRALGALQSRWAAPDTAQAVLMGVKLESKIPAFVYVLEVPWDLSAATFFPSVDLNPASGIYLISYAASSAHMYASVFGATLDAVRGEFYEILVKEGEAPYTRPRWGDYSAAQFDPARPERGWVFGEWSRASNEWVVEAGELEVSLPISFRALSSFPAYGGIRVPVDTTVTITFDGPVILGSYHKVRLQRSGQDPHTPMPGACPEPLPFDCEADGAECFRIGDIGTVDETSCVVELTFPRGSILENSAYQLGIEHGAIYRPGSDFAPYPGIPFTTVGFRDFKDSPIYHAGFAGDGSGFTAEVFCRGLRAIFTSLRCDAIRILSITQGSFHVIFQIVQQTTESLNEIARIIISNQFEGAFTQAFAREGLEVLFVGPSAIGSQRGRFEVINEPSCVDCPTHITMTIHLPPTSTVENSPVLTVIVPVGLDVTGTDTLTLTAGSDIVMMSNIVDGRTLVGDIPSNFMVSAGGTFTVEFNARMPPTCEEFNTWLWGYQVAVRGEPNDINIQNVPADQCQGRTSIVFGDPHFISLSGGSYEVAGSSGTIYNIISTKRFTWNSRFVAREDGRQMDTYLGPTGFLINGTRVVVVPDKKKLTVELEDTIITQYDVRVPIAPGSPYYIKVTPTMVMLRVPGYRLAMKYVRLAHHHVVPHFDYFLELTDEKNEREDAHGLLGQTERLTEVVKPHGKNGQGVIEGTVDDYIVSSLLNTKYVFSRSQ